MNPHEKGSENLTFVNNIPDFNLNNIVSGWKHKNTHVRRGFSKWLHTALIRASPRASTSRAAGEWKPKGFLELEENPNTTRLKVHPLHQTVLAKGLQDLATQMPAMFPPWFMSDLKHVINTLFRFFSYREVSIFFQNRCKRKLKHKAWSVNEVYNWKKEEYTHLRKISY